MPLGISSKHISKASGALFVVRMVVKVSYGNLWLEWGSLNIINTLNNKNVASWTIESIISEVKELPQNFNKVHISHSIAKHIGWWIGLAMWSSSQVSK